jgi:hypothetical protein
MNDPGAEVVGHELTESAHVILVMMVARCKRSQFPQKSGDASTAAHAGRLKQRDPNGVKGQPGRELSPDGKVQSSPQHLQAAP